MARTVIASVGTSLLTNKTWKWRRGNPLPRAEDMLESLRTTKLTEGSAETHTLYRLPLMDDDTLHWLSSNTEECKQCAGVLNEYYGVSRSDVHVIKELNYRKGDFERGLKALATTAARIVSDAGGPDDVVICATGGFKPEAAYLNIVGLLLDIPVYYLYEGLEHIVKLPRPPIERWDVDGIIEYLQAL